MLQKIKLNKIDDVREFVTAAGKCDFDIDLSYGRVTVDAKSLMGILGMDLANALTVVCHGEDRDFTKTIKKWAVG
ncbi:MAG: HPr family phosphocarrier protein [Blautia sp.]|nr:HPr family phosphocarrier protein [Blautia sp.]